MPIQDLRASPAHPIAGQSATITFAPPGSGPIANVELQLCWPPATEARALGVTDAAGRVTFTPERAGDALVQASRNGIDYVLPLAVQSARSPLGYALPWALAALALLVIERLASRRVRAASPAALPADRREHAVGGSDRHDAERDPPGLDQQ